MWHYLFLEKKFSPEELVQNREHARRLGEGDTYFFRNPGLLSKLAEQTYSVPEGKSLPFEVDGDSRGKTSVSIRLAQAKEKLRRNPGLSDEALFKKLSTKFPLHRRDINPSKIEDGKIELTTEDVQLMPASGMLETAMKFLKLNPDSTISGKFEMKNPLRESLGTYEQIDVLDAKQGPAIKKVRVTENLWQLISRGDGKRLCTQVR